MYLTPAWKAALPLTIAWGFFEKMFFGTLDALDVSPVLLGLAVGMLLLDTVTGCYKGWASESDELNTHAFGAFFDKIVKYAAVVVVFSSIAAVAERGQLPEIALAWIRDFGYLVIVVREGGSALENLWEKPLGKLLGQFRDTVSNVSR